MTKNMSSGYLEEWLQLYPQKLEQAEKYSSLFVLSFSDEEEQVFRLVHLLQLRQLRV